ncbi:MAG: PTS sugar transporter subunit IIA [Calditrichaeota bacterium]|nr:MAG: PTS sugar transporter subunit IIA [Calditrichota bacterium]
MDISQFMRPDLIFLDVRGQSKIDIFREIIEGMAKRHVIEHPKAFLEEIVQREAQAPTCIGRGVALPHTRTIFVDKPIIAFARTYRPISFGQQPEDSVEMIFLMGTPKEDPNTYLRILGNLCKLLRKKEIRELLMRASTPGEILQIISETKQFQVY